MSVTSEERMKHLEMIQGVIGRLSTNSFFVKGWSVTLAAALFAFAVENRQWVFSALGAFTVLIFWLLDAYYLRHERLFRELYNDARLSSSTVREFSMDTTLYFGNVPSVPSIALTTSQVGLHGVLFLLGIVISIVVRCMS